MSELQLEEAQQAQQVGMKRVILWTKVVDRLGLEQAGFGEAERQKAHEIQMPSKERQNPPGYPVCPRKDR